MGAYVYEINAWTDHVHVVVANPPQVAVSALVKEIKGASSHDINQQRVLECRFAWQRGYGALSLGQKQKPDAEAYVRNQKEHHRRQTTVEWLERYTEYDEGPLDLGVRPKVAVPRLSEEGVVYDFLGESPF